MHLLLFCHNGSKQGKDSWQHIYINFAIFGEEWVCFGNGWTERPQGELPATEAVCEQASVMLATYGCM